MSIEELPYSPQAYSGHRIVTISADNPTWTPTLEYDPEAAQGSRYSPSMHALKNAPSLGRMDMGVFERYIETSERKATPHGTRSKSNLKDHSLILSEIVPREDIQQSGRNSLRVMRWILVVLVLGILWVPGVWIEVHSTMILGVRMLNWSIWLTIVWAGFWMTIAVAYLTASVFKSAPTVVSLRRSRHVHEVRTAHKYLGVVVWTIIIFISYQPLVARSLQPKTSAEDTAIIKVLGMSLLAKFICAAILALEKYSFQRISENFHERSYADRIKDHETVVQALCILYKNTVDIAVRSDARSSGLILSLNAQTGWHERKLSDDQLKGIGNGSAVSEIMVSSAPQEQATEQYVIAALSTPSKSRLLAKRIFYSFSRPGTNNVRAEDIAAFFTTPEHAGAAFAVLDRDGNGDISREELDAACLAFHQEQVAIENSMRDMDAALNQLDGIMASLGYVACVVVFTVVMDAQLASLIAGVGVLVLGMSWLAGGSLQEVMTSTIFLFEKHPFDVGDSVIIKDESYIVEEIKLLSTVFLDTNSTLVQVSNHHLNNLFIFNTRRSSQLSETFIFDVHYATTFQEVEKIRQKMLEFVKSECRDFQPVFDLEVKDFPGQSKIVLSADIKYRGNIVGLKVARRNKWLYALKSTLTELCIYGPTGEPNVPLNVRRHTKVSSRGEPEDDQAQTQVEAL